jgi:hypothetical protein
VGYGVDACESRHKLEVSGSSDSNPFPRKDTLLLLSLSCCGRKKRCPLDQCVLFLALSFSADYHGLYCLIVRLDMDARTMQTP